MDKLKSALFGVILATMPCAAGETKINPIANPRIVALSQNKREIVRAFLRRASFIRGSLHPVRLVLFPSGSSEQASLAKFVGVPEVLLELEIQKTANRSAQPKRVSSDKEMVEVVGGYVGSLGYLVSDGRLIYNDRGTVVFLEVL